MKSVINEVCSFFEWPRETVQVMRGSNCVAVLSTKYVARLPFRPAEVDFVHEARRLTAVRRSGIPAPRPVLVMMVGSSVPCLLYERIRGSEPTASFKWSSIAKVLCQLWAMDVAEFPLEPRMPRRRMRFRDAELGALQDGVTEEQRRCLHLAARTTTRVPVHGDFRTCNLLAKEGDLCGVLDWSDAHLGSPESDVGLLPPDCWRTVVDGVDRFYSISMAKVVGFGLSRILALIRYGVVNQEELATWLGQVRNETWIYSWDVREGL